MFAFSTAVPFYYYMLCDMNLFNATFWFAIVMFFLKIKNIIGTKQVQD